MAAADAIVIFGANSVTLKYDPMFYFTQNWFLCMYVGFVYVILKYIFIVSSHIRNYREKNNMVLLKSYEAVTAMAVALVAPPVNER